MDLGYAPGKRGGYERPAWLREAWLLKCPDLRGRPDLQGQLLLDLHLRSHCMSLHYWVEAFRLVEVDAAVCLEIFGLTWRDRRRLASRTVHGPFGSRPSYRLVEVVRAARASARRRCAEHGARLGELRRTGRFVVAVQRYRPRREARSMPRVRGGHAYGAPSRYRPGVLGCAASANTA